MALKRHTFDIIVLGSGPGGYPAAIAAAQAGKSVALIEAKELGGTCLNRGCIPSKALIACADVLKQVEQAKEFGINTGKISFDYKKMAGRKDHVVSHIREGLTGLIKANGITLFQGYGKFLSPKTLKIQGKDSAEITAEKIIIATGSEPKEIATFPFDHKKILDSTSTLELKKLPKSMAIVGGGIIGCEFASLFSALGVKITVIEMLPKILPTESDQISDVLTQAFRKKGIQMKTGKAVKSIDKTQKGVKITLDKKKIEAEMAIGAIGRHYNTDQINIEKTGVKVNDNGQIPVNDKMETNVPGIYAIGDLVSKWLLAHIATHQGIVAAQNACGGEAHIEWNAIPSVIFTDPEIATVGLSFEEAKEQGYDAGTGAFPFQALGKSQASNHTEGFTQIVTDKKTGQILGAQAIGHEAGAMIAEMGVAIANELTLGCITETMHAHPTISEAWMEAAFMAKGNPLHLPPKKK